MITNKEVEKIAKLAKLKFTDNEITSLASQLTNIMDMIDSLNEVNCDNVQPLTSVSDMILRMRKDEVTVEDLSHELLENAPGQNAKLAQDIKCFVVPKVIE
jgi:aspartyl-tRNA(Asn)/glutamyl-tRNA(Gln) amidotransferase subunit C